MGDALRSQDTAVQIGTPLESGSGYDQLTAVWFRCGIENRAAL